MSLSLDTFILIVMIASGLWAVMTRSLLRSALALALTSATLAVVMFRLNSPLAAVFELSVCTGLISVLFIATISLTTPMTHKEIMTHMRERLKRFVYLPFVIVAIGIALSMISVRFNLALPGPQAGDVRDILWNARRVDMLGQIAMLLCGVFGVVVLLKERLKR